MLMSQGQSYLELRDVTLSFNNGTEASIVLDGISLSARRGAFVSFIGPSGCGKTTLLRMIAGLITANTGSIVIDGIDAAAAREKSRIGFVFQQPVLFEWRTVEENVRLPGEVLGSNEVSGRARDYLEMVGLRGFENYFPRELSGGMQSRAAIARALIHQPDLLLLDEPFADLDEITRERMNLELLRIWSETSTTMIFVTHNLEEAVFLSDCVHVFSTPPSRVLATIPIELPRPRTIDMLDSEAYSRCLHEVRESLRIASGLSHESAGERASPSQASEGCAR